MSFSDSRILNLYNPSKMSSGGIFVMDNRIPSHFESNSWISSFRASVGNLWTSTYLGLEPYLPASKGCWRRELVKMEIRNLQSLLVCSIILWRVSSTEYDWIYGWRPRLASQILILFLPSTFLHCRWMERLLDRWIPSMQFLRIRGWWRRIWICTNVSRKTMCVPNAWRSFSAAGVTKECLNIPSGIGWGGNDTGRLVTWEFPLRIESASWKSFFAHAIYFILQFLYSARKFQYGVLIFD